MNWIRARWWITAVALALVVPACVPPFHSVNVSSRTRVSADPVEFRAQMWLPPAIFEDWTETTVAFTVFATGLSGGAIPEDLEPGDADFDVVIGGPFDETFRVAGSRRRDHDFSWPVDQCVDGCLLDVPIRFQSRVPLPEGVAWNIHWRFAVVYPKGSGDHPNPLGAQGWLLEDGGSPQGESWLSTEPEKVDLNLRPITRTVTVDLEPLVGRDFGRDSSVRLYLGLSPTSDEVWVPVTARFRRAGDHSGTGWETRVEPGLVNRFDPEAVAWDIPLPDCREVCTVDIEVSLQADEATSVWWWPTLSGPSEGTRLTIAP